MSSLALPRNENSRKSNLTRAGAKMASISKEELNVLITVPSTGELAIAMTARSEPAPGMFCTMTEGSPAR